MKRQKRLQITRIFLLPILITLTLLNLPQLHADEAYWTTARGIQRGDLVSGLVETIIPVTVGIPLGIALDAGSGKVYWGDGGTGKIQRADLDGSNIKDLVEVFAIDHRPVYFKLAFIIGQEGGAST